MSEHEPVLKIQGLCLEDQGDLMEPLDWTVKKMKFRHYWPKKYLIPQ